MMILEFIFFISFETLCCLKSEKDYEDDKDKTNEKDIVPYETIVGLIMNDEQKLEKLPQTIARRNLDDILKTIIKIILLSCRNSERCSTFLAGYKKFFLKMVHFYPEDVTGLLEEIASNLTDFTSGVGQKSRALETGENPNDIFIKALGKIEDQLTRNEEDLEGFHITWTKSLEDVNSITNNNGNQIFLFDMLSALMYNKKTSKSVKKYQKAIFKELFGHKKGGFLKFGLK